MSHGATHPPRPSCDNLAEFAWWKIFYFKKPIKLTSAAGVTLMGQYKHTNINLTTENDGVRLINSPCFKNVCDTHNDNNCISYTDFDHDCALRCV